MGVTPQRNITVDIAKGICIILVVIGHFHPANSPQWYETVFQIIYSFHMPLFMFVSGYLYMLTRRADTEYKSFLLKKAKRLMIPYFAASIIIISIKLATQGSMSVENPVTWMSYLKMFYLPEAGYFMWFIWALWWIFVIVGLCKSTKSITVLSTAAAVFYFVPVSLPETFALAQLKRMMIFFMLGTLVVSYKDYFNKITRIYSLIPFVAFVVAECVLLPQFGNVPISVKFMFTSLLGIWCIVLISRWMKQYHNLFTKSILKVSICSYIIYLFHTTFEGFFKSIFSRIISGADSELTFIAAALFVIIPGVVLPMLLQMYVLSKNKCLLFLFGLDSFSSKKPSLAAEQAETKSEEPVILAER